jgi:hypothetical protein
MMRFGPRRVSAAFFSILVALTAACARSPTAPSETESAGALTSGRTYYVAANQPGADNDRCDGSAPTDLGNNRCPFRDFRSPRTARVLNGVTSVRVEVRAGTYTFVGEGLTVQGTGATVDQSVVLTAFGGEQVIFDGEGTLNATVRVSGRFATVTGITFVRGGGYNLELRGGQHVRIVGNRFLSNASSDSLKGSDGAADVEIRDNEFTQWDSQAIDVTSGARWEISGNTFHDPLKLRSKAIGAKLGSRDIHITQNQFRSSGGVALGGTSALHPDTHEAFGVVVERNTFERIGGHVAALYSCLGCRFSDNSVSGAEFGLRLGGRDLDGSSGCAGGCQPTRDTVVDHNRFREIVGDAATPTDVFWLLDGTERQGLSAAGNVYCLSGGQPARFALAPSVLTFEEWMRVVQTDTTSMVASSQDGRCQGW